MCLSIVSGYTAMMASGYSARLDALREHFSEDVLGLSAIRPEKRQDNQQVANPYEPVFIEVCRAIHNAVKLSEQKQHVCHCNREVAIDIAEASARFTAAIVVVRF